MGMKDRIPKGFYKLFGSKYTEYYQQCLLAVYEESGSSYSLLGLTEEECHMLIQETMTKLSMDFSQEQMDEEGEILTRSTIPSVFLRHFEEWGWLKRDYDEVLNCYVVSFPDYSQLFLELFCRLYREEESKERESILTVYSHLFTYSSDPEKNNEILKSALTSSRRLLQMLSNMQDGIRGYFDELSKQKTFLGVQEVLIQEINNSDSRKYAILTTTDSFYRYKEAVKELIDQNIEENELRKRKFEEERRMSEEGTPKWIKWNREALSCEEAMEILRRIEREFDAIERRYNKLIEQKMTFAKRAAARIRYILIEGDEQEDPVKALVKLLNESGRKEEILDECAKRISLTERFQTVTEKGLYRPKGTEKKGFHPVSVTPEGKGDEALEEFVLKPLYTNAEIDSFWRKNEKDGAFRATTDTVRSVEDLEKLFFVWQEMTQVEGESLDIHLDQEIESEGGFRYSGLSIERK